MVVVKINQSSWDSVFRIFSGFFLLYLGLAGELTGLFSILADLLGIFSLFTGVIGFCPLYTLFRRKK
ncbi:MAG: YgaP family membrane protein [Anaerolineales bacterium]